MDELRDGERFEHARLGRAHVVIPAKAGIQMVLDHLDPRLRGGDEKVMWE